MHNCIPCSKGLQLPLNTCLMLAPPGTSRCRNTEISVLPGKKKNHWRLRSWVMTDQIKDRERERERTWTHYLTKIVVSVQSKPNKSLLSYWWIGEKKKQRENGVFCNKTKSFILSNDRKKGRRCLPSTLSLSTMWFFFALKLIKTFPTKTDGS